MVPVLPMHMAVGDFLGRGDPHRFPFFGSVLVCSCVLCSLVRSYSLRQLTRQSRCRLCCVICLLRLCAKLPTQFILLLRAHLQLRLELRHHFCQLFLLVLHGGGLPLQSLGLPPPFCNCRLALLL